MELTKDFKNMTKDVLYRTGISGFLLRLLRQKRYPKLLIFSYHRICRSMRDYEYMAIPQDIFESQVRFIKNNFRIVSMSEGLQTLYGDDPRDVCAAINFDDGYMDNYLFAYPILKKYNVPAAIFLVTDFIGKRHIFWWDNIFSILYSLKSQDMKVDIDSKTFRFRLNGISQIKQATDSIDSFLSTKNEEKIKSLIGTFEKKYSSRKVEPISMFGWDEIKEMSRGGISFGSHAKTHRNLCSLKDDEVREELAGSKKKIEKMIGLEVDGFAYPFGVFDERVKRFAKEAGFKYARTSFNGINHRDSDKFLLGVINLDFLDRTSFMASRILFSHIKSNVRKIYL